MFGGFKVFRDHNGSFLSFPLDVIVTVPLTVRLTQLPLNITSKNANDL